MDFWNSELTEKSWEVLLELRKKYDFIIIGGWSAYLWAKQQKSKDLDIVVDIEELQKLKQEALIKNDNLKKYEIKRGEIDVDIYVSYYSKLAIPAEDMKKYSSSVEGFQVSTPEALLILKQGAELDRGNSIKGEKDRLDIMSLLLFTDIDFKKYKSILKTYSLDFYIDALIKLVKSFNEYGHFFANPRDFKLKREEILKALKML